nr:zinc finger protein 391-like [Aedes albopictus]XP_029729262.1 zinc finger protein 391-like [Aedes albopictus]XP_029729263.1 zinc finger protein 391-like [Aedes albopictus]
MDHQTIAPFEMHKICRLCLQQLQPGALVDLFTPNFSIRPSEMIARCASVEIYEKDGLPGAICNDCFYKLGIAFEFRNRCESSDQKLRSYVREQHGGHRPVSSVVPTVAKDDEIYAAMSEIFGDEEEPIGSKSLEVLSECKSDVLLETTKTHGNAKKVEPMKKRAQLDELLVKHRAKLKEEGRQVNIFRQKKSSKKTEQKDSKRGTLLKEPEHCVTCGKTFNYSGYLLAHQRIHTGEKPFVCQICNRRFAQSGNLQLHLRIHNNERKFQCEICSKLFRTSSNLHAHKKTHSEERNFPCSLCERAFRTAQELKNHSETHNAIKSYVCQLCDDRKAFQKQSYLNSHVKTVHIGVKRHRCQDCGKIFSNSSNLIAHRRVHSGDRPYNCKECDAKFTQSPALLRHIKAKHRPKPAEPVIQEEITDEVLEPSVDVDENASLDSATSSELSVATSLIENHSGYNMPYMPTYVPSQPQHLQHQMPPSHHHLASSSAMQMPPTASGGNMYASSDPYQYPAAANPSAMQAHHYPTQQHLDVGGGYDMCYTMPAHTVLNPSLMNSQPTYIFDQ